MCLFKFDLYRYNPFKDYSNCRQHYLRRHTVEKPYSCAKCARGYAVKPRLGARLALRVRQWA